MKYRMVLRLDDRLSEYFDEVEFDSLDECISVARYVCTNGYPFGEYTKRVITCTVLQYETVCTIQGQAHDLLEVVT
jgi:hypothetical protein